MLYGILYTLSAVTAFKNIYEKPLIKSIKVNIYCKLCSKKIRETKMRSEFSERYQVLIYADNVNFLGKNKSESKFKIKCTTWIRSL